MDENKFLHEIETRAELTRVQAFEVAIAVLQELHDRLSPKEADHLAAQLPKEFKSRWHAFDAPGREVRRTHKKDFMHHVVETAEITHSQAGKALMATFKALQMLLGSPTGREGEAWNVLSQLPKDLKLTWLDAAAMPAVRPAKAAPKA